MILADDLSCLIKRFQKISNVLDLTFEYAYTIKCTYFF